MSIGALAQGQGVLQLAIQPVCWSYNNVDSNINAYYLYSSRVDTPRLINYLNPLGQPVDVSSGGAFQNGFCCCSSSTSVGNRTIASQTDSLLGLTTYLVGNIDTVGLDIAGLTQSAPKGDGFLVFYDVTNNRNYKVLLSTLIPEPYPGFNSCECDTIYQAGHGFALGNILGQVRGNGDFFEASTGDPDSLPVAYVHEVLHVDTFVIKSEGWLMDWAHGLPLGRDYFVQDTPGVLDTIPDSTYHAFAFRTVNTGKAYFDIPELVVDQAPGSSPGGGGTVTTLIQDSILIYSISGVEVSRDTIRVGSGGSALTVTASNGLNDQDAGPDVDVELGGTLDKATDVVNPSFLFRLGKLTGTPVNYFFNNAATGASGIYSNDSGTTEEVQVNFLPSGIAFQSAINSLANATLFQMENDLVRLYSQVSSVARGVLYVDTSLVRIRFNNNTGNVQSAIEWNNQALLLTTYNSTGTVVQTEIELTDDNIRVEGIPNYASDAAADADGGLCSNCIYTVTAEDRTIRIKP